MKIKDGIILKNVMDSYILIDVKNDFKGVIKLNKTSKDVFELIDDGYSILDIKEKLLSKYEVDKDTLDKDIDDVIERFKELNIIND